MCLVSDSSLTCFVSISPQMSGIRDLIPGSVIDATMFNPCGYSMNGMKADVSVSDPQQQPLHRATDGPKQKLTN